MSSDLQHDHDDAEPKKASKEILRHELNEGMDALTRSSSRLLMSACSAGMDIGYSLFLIAVVTTLAKDEISPPVLEMLLALMYPLGFILVVLGRSELFTEQTTLAVLPYLSGEATLKMVGRLWGIVYLGNLIGATVFAAIVAVVGPSLGVIDATVLGDIAHHVVTHRWWVILVSGILAGWLMGLLSWLVAAGRDTISQIVIVMLITATIGISNLHHSIVGTVEVLAGIFSGGKVGMADFLHFLVWATLGNAIGGSFFVAILKYGQAREPRSRD